MANLPFIQFFSANGDGTGATNMGVDGGTPAKFTVDGPTDGTTIKVARLIVAVEDNAAMTNTSFGAISTLTNGVGLEIVDSSDATILDLTPITIKQNSDWEGTPTTWKSMRGAPHRTTDTSVRGGRSPSSWMAASA